MLERNRHLCTNEEFVDHFKARFMAMDAKMFNNTHLNFDIDEDLQNRQCLELFVTDVLQPLGPELEDKVAQLKAQLVEQTSSSQSSKGKTEEEQTGKRNYDSEPVR